MELTFILYIERKYFLHKKFYSKIHYLSTYFSIYLSVCLSTYAFVNLSSSLLIFLSVSYTCISK